MRILLRDKCYPSEQRNSVTAYGPDPYLDANTFHKARPGEGNSVVTSKENVGNPRLDGNKGA